jgi:hypothetical protein
MDDRNSKLDAATTAARQIQTTRRRVKRGVVAGYIHEISARHQHVAPVVARRAEPAPTLVTPR